MVHGPTKKGAVLFLLCSLIIIITQAKQNTTPHFTSPSNFIGETKDEWADEQ
jgi:hypothetical protein